MKTKWNKDGKIETLEQLVCAADHRRSVTMNQMNMGRPLPAAFVLNCQAIIVWNLLRSGMWVYGEPSCEVKK